MQNAAYCQQREIYQCPICIMLSSKLNGCGFELQNACLVLPSRELKEQKIAYCISTDSLDIAPHHVGSVMSVVGSMLLGSQALFVLPPLAYRHASLTGYLPHELLSQAVSFQCHAVRFWCTDLHATSTGHAHVLLTR